MERIDFTLGVLSGILIGVAFARIYFKGKHESESKND